MDSLATTIGNNVRKYRESQGLTQAELAEAAQLHRNYIASVEKGRRNLSVLSVQKIANALKVKVQRLFDEEIQQEL